MPLQSAEIFTPKIVQFWIISTNSLPVIKMADFLFLFPYESWELFFLLKKIFSCMRKIFLLEKNFLEWENFSQIRKFKKIFSYSIVFLNEKIFSCIRKLFLYEKIFSNIRKVFLFQENISQSRKCTRIYDKLHFLK